MYIITGATGHIGNNVVRYLLSKNMNVRVLIRKSDQSLDGLVIDKKTSTTFDFDFLNDHINEGDIIIHCAAYIDLMNRDLMQTFRTNVQLTKRLIAVATNKNCRLIYLSSVDVIPKQKRGLVKEPLTLEKTKNKSYYRTSKAVATNEVLHAIQHGLNGMVLYPSAVVGINDYKPSAAGREILHVIQHKILFSLHGGYNFIDVEDVSKSVYQASVSSLNDHLIISGHEITIRGLYEKIETLSKMPKWIIPLPLFLVRLAILFSKKYSQMMISTIQENYHYDNSQMISLLKIVPTPLDETLDKTIHWLKEHYTK